jgi:hypothetical protein
VLNRSALLSASVLMAVSLITAAPAFTQTKWDPHPFYIRGQSPFAVGTGTCGVNTCVTYSGSQTGVIMPRIGKNLTFNWNLNQGVKLSTTPDGGSCYSADGSGTITKGSSLLFDVQIGAGVFCTSPPSLANEILYKFAAALTGEGDETGLTGIIDLSVLLNLINNKANFEGDGNFTD